MSTRCAISVPLRPFLLFLPLAACLDQGVTEPEPKASSAAAPAERGRQASTEIVIELGTLGGEATSALDINDRGQVVGTSENADGIQRAFLWTAREGMRDLGGLSDGPAAALAISAAGQAVGWSTAEDGRRFATRWLPSGEIVVLPHTDVGGPPTPAAAVAINSRGDAVGFTGGDAPALWPARGGVDDVCPMTGFPSGINDAGTIVGIASTVVGGFLQRGNVTFEYSGFIRTSRDNECRGLVDDEFVVQEATAINNRGEVAGWGGEWRPLPFDPASLELLTAFVSFVYSDRTGFRTGHGLPARPLAINNRGTVVGDEVAGINDAGDRVGGAFLWTERPNRFGVSPSAATSPPAQRGAGLSASWPAAEESFGPRACLGALGHLVRIGALPECPAPAGR